MPRTFYLILCITLAVSLLAVSSVILKDQYYLVSLVILLIGFIPLFARLETGTFKGRELVLIAVLSAIGVACRFSLPILPAVKPTSMIILATGWALGPEIGWIVGANVALVSNFFLGQGPWTPWQMFAWSLMGLTAGWLRNVWWMQRLIGKILFGFVWGILFGWIMDLQIVSGGFGAMGMMSFVQMFTSSFAVDVMHGMTNAVLILWLWKPMEKILLRFKRKYRLIKQSSE